VLWEEVARKLSPALARRWSASNVAEVDTTLLSPPPPHIAGCACCD
jgi:hypothetical protein